MKNLRMSKCGGRAPCMRGMCENAKRHSERKSEQSLGKGSTCERHDTVNPVSRKWSAFTFQGLMSAVTLKRREAPQSSLIPTRSHTDTLACVYKRAIFSVTAIALRGTCNTQGPSGRFSSLALIHHTPLLYLSPPSPTPSFSAANYSSAAFSRK